MKSFIIKLSTSVKSEIIGVILVLSLTFISNSWVLDARNGFVFDDYTYMYRFEFSNIAERLSIIPKAQYNDRPVGELFLHTLFEIFGNNNVGHHFVLLGVHLLNTFFVYLLCKKLYDLFAINSLITPLLNAAVFGLWPKSVMCVQWDAAIFDLLGATFILICLNLYLSTILSKRYFEFNSIFLVVFYFTALRTKEMTILIPVIILLFDILYHLFKQGFSIQALRNFKINKLLILLNTLMVLYTALIMVLGRENKITADVNGPYFYTFKLDVIFQNFLRYLSMYFDYTNFQFGFTGFNFISYFAIGLFVIGLVYSIYLAGKEDYLLLWMYIGFAMTLSPVLPMKNMQHILYLYIPSIFLAFIISFLISKIVGIQKFQFRHSQTGVLIVALLLLWLLTIIPSVKNFRSWWLQIGQNNQQTINDLKQLPKPEKNTTLYVTDVDDSSNAFYYGPGFIVKIIFDDPTITTVINPQEIDRTVPYLVLKYDNARVTLVEKNKPVQNKTSP